MVTDPVNTALKGFAPSAFTNPWEGQGTEIGDNGPSSTPPGGSGWWDRWGENVFNSIPDYLDSLGGLFNGNQNPRAQTPPPATSAQSGSNTTAWVFGGVVVILLLILLLRK